MKILGRHHGRRLGFGLVCLLAAEFLVVAGCWACCRPDDVPPATVGKTIVGIGLFSLGTAAAGWWLTCRSSLSAATRPAVAVAGGLAASLVRLLPPLALLGWLQQGAGEDQFPPPLRAVAGGTLVASYLVLLLVAILLQLVDDRSGGRGRPPERPN